MAEPDVAPELRELSRRLLPKSDELGDRMAERICAEIPYYAEGSVVTVQDLAASSSANIRWILGRLSGAADELRGAWVTGTARAEQGVPYPAVLGAYRVGSRFLWEQMVERADPGTRDTLLLAAADIWTISDEMAAVVTEAYRSALTAKARRDEQLRSVVVSALLDGEVGGPDELWRSVDALDIDPVGRFVVVAAENFAGAPVALGDIERQLRGRNVVSAWRLDQDHHEGLVVLRTGFTTGDLVEQLSAVAEGRVGLSAQFTRLDDAPLARVQARLAVRSGTPGQVHIRRFDDDPLAVLLASAPDRGRDLVRTLLGPVLDLPGDDRLAILATVRAWFDSGGSPSLTAERLFLHRNTVRYRLNRFQDLTGRDVTDPVAATHVYVALECARLLGLDS